MLQHNADKLRDEEGRPIFIEDPYAAARKSKPMLFFLRCKIVFPFFVFVVACVAHLFVCVCLFSPR